MNVLVVDDEPLARRRLVDMLSDAEDYSVVGEAADGVSALRLCQELQPDVALLDIRMPGMDGLEVARHLDRLEEPPAVLFCTAYDEYAVSAFDVHAVGYLLKPVRRADLFAALQNASRTNRAQLQALDEEVGSGQSEHAGRTHFSVRSHRGIDLIPVGEVLFFMADQKYVRIRHLHGEALTDETLKELEAEFPSRFIRVHRNALISFEYLDGLERGRDGHYLARMKEVDERIPVSRRSVPELKKLLTGT